jgi:hypothetical protein
MAMAPVLRQTQHLAVAVGAVTLVVAVMGAVTVVVVVASIEGATTAVLEATASVPSANFVARRDTP